jgi:hypothetical protein
MGTPTAALEWHGSTLLRRTAGIVARATGDETDVIEKDVNIIRDDFSRPPTNSYEVPHLSRAYSQRPALAV